MNEATGSVEENDGLDAAKDADARRLALASWSNLDVPDEILKALDELKFYEPTPIQIAAIPAAMRDKLDILGAAATGSGKTLAFGIPLINYIMSEKNEDGAVKMLRGLIITPTRELAMQIKKHLDAVAKYTGVTTACLVGGLAVQKQERILRTQRPDIVIATPGRLWETIESNSQSHVCVASIKELRFLVIDEADRMTEKGHFEELTRLMELIKSKDDDLNMVAFDDQSRQMMDTIVTDGVTSDELVDDEVEEVDEETEPEEPKKKFKRQILIFSATLTLVHGGPDRFNFDAKKKRKAAEKLSLDGKLDHLMHLLGMRVDKAKVIDLTNKGIGRPDEDQLKETVIMCPKVEKDMYLYYFLTLFPGRSIVFCNSKDCLRRLTSVLRILEQNPLSIHGDVDQKKRLVALEKFTSVPGKGLLIASDVAARGLDISDIDHVIHYQCPRTSENYVHRSGRTARANCRGMTLVLVEPKEGVAYSKLCNSVNSGNHLTSFPIDDEVMPVIRARVDLAQRIDILEHGLRKVKVKSDWFRKAADEMDIDIEGRDDLFNEENRETAKLADDRSKSKGLKNSLCNLLKQPIASKKSLVTMIKSNNFEHPSIIGSKTALETIESSADKKKHKLKLSSKLPSKNNKVKKPKFKKRKRK